MKIIVPVRMVPDLVEELEINESEKRLNTSSLRMIVSEADDNAIEEAIIFKEKYGAEITVIAPDIGDCNDILFASFAKGADRLIKITGLPEELNSHLYAKILSEIIKNMEYDFILTGCQSVMDLDGQTGILLAGELNLPYVGMILKIEKKNGFLSVNKEFPGGVYAKYSVEIPAVLGILSSENPPRYIPVAKIRAAMKSAKIEEISAPDIKVDMGFEVIRVYKPEVSKGAEIIQGSLDEIAKKLVDILEEKGLL
ncbi:MAG: electron transfer flavoprotein subunit beta/FixA family protein [candidate division WOR-3 bacterium]